MIRYFWSCVYQMFL